MRLEKKKIFIYLSKFVFKKKKSGNFNFKLLQNSFKFSEVFSFLLNNLKANGLIKDFSITQCSLEQIFIHFSKLQNDFEP